MIPVVISDEEFRRLVAKRGQTLLKLANYLSQRHSPGEILTRPLLGTVLSQSAQVEELLDAYGARNNRRWCTFRLLTATLKLFSDVSYEILHIQHALPAYQLLPIEEDFVKATEQALMFTGDVILRTGARMVSQAHQLNLPVPEADVAEETYAEHLPPGRLHHDRATHKIDDVAKTVTMLSTAFLNEAAESKLVHAACQARPEEYESYIPHTISEEMLRNIQLRFHNLQSLYDTYVSETETENIDADLPVMRGHITVVYHLLKTAKSFAHYYERHVKKKADDLSACQDQLVDPDALLTMLMNYSVRFVSLYLGCAQRLCHAMLKRYIDVGRIELPVPRYRGFHVRPSTLISRLVLHYGSEVSMELEDEKYDAGSPLELFRANEKMNAQKRRWLASEIVRLGLVPKELTNSDITAIIRSVVITLAERSRLVIYEQPLHLPEGLTRKDGTLLEQVIDEIAQLLAIGKIDVDADLKVTFIGDKRVLEDIKLLSEYGYGEDKFGNNVTLPEKLEYLRR
jgi:hypothetical protein